MVKGIWEGLTLVFVLHPTYVQTLVQGHFYREYNAQDRSPHTSRGSENSLSPTSIPLKKGAP